MPKEKKPSQQEIDNAIRDRGPFYKDSKGRKSQIPSQEMYANQPEPTYWEKYGDIGRVEAPLANVDIMGNVTGPEDTTKTYAMGGLTSQPTLNYMGAKKGGNISKGKNGGKTVIKKFGHEGAIDPNKAQITKLLSKGGEILARGNKIAKHKPTKLY
jgi:hypothetical protein